MTNAHGNELSVLLSVKTSVARLMSHGQANTGKAIISINTLNQPGTLRE